jgi:hypothetical protein
MAKCSKEEEEEEECKNKRKKKNCVTQLGAILVAEHTLANPLFDDRRLVRLSRCGARLVKCGNKLPQDCSGQLRVLEKRRERGQQLHDPGDRVRGGCRCRRGGGSRRRTGRRHAWLATDKYPLLQRRRKVVLLRLKFTELLLQAADRLSRRIAGWGGW